MKLIEGIGIAGFRSFGAETQRLGPLSKINLLIGANNCGKSNSLICIQRYFPQVGNDSTNFSVGGNDAPLSGPCRLVLERGFNKTALRDKTASFDQYNRRLFERLLASEVLTRNTELVWLPILPGNDPLVVLGTELYENNILSDGDWVSLWKRFQPSHGGGSIASYPADILRIITTVERINKVVVIPAIRKIGDPESAVSFDGSGMIERLARLQNPDADTYYTKNKELFAQITSFLREVLGNNSAEIEVPYSRDSILVRMDGKTLPIGSLGTGVQEVLILAVAATLLQDQLVCIEEPELHLHPLLQKQLLNYLLKTSNQYLITTHSAHLLDTSGVTVFHTRLHEKNTRVEFASSDNQKSEICKALGYKASDLMQANCVIWVEGPSDRIYLNYWIKSKAPWLTENLHYSIMFYGGRLLSHLTGSDLSLLRTASDDTELMAQRQIDAIQTEQNLRCAIELRRLNRYITIVIDSDKTMESDPVNQTKERIFTEFERGPGFAWITAGRTIENYIAPSTLFDAISKVHPKKFDP